MRATAEAARLEAAHAEAAEWAEQDDNAAGAVRHPMVRAMHWTPSGAPSEQAISTALPEAADSAFADGFRAARPDGVQSPAQG